MLTRKTYSHRNDYGECGDQGHGAPRCQLRAGGHWGSKEAGLGYDRIGGKAPVGTALDCEQARRKMEPLEGWGD